MSLDASFSVLIPEEDLGEWTKLLVRLFSYSQNDFMKKNKFWTLSSLLMRSLVLKLKA